MSKTLFSIVATLAIAAVIFGVGNPKLALAGSTQISCPGANYPCGLPTPVPGPANAGANPCANPTPYVINGTAATFNPWPNTPVGKSLWICAWHVQVFATSTPSAGFAYSTTPGACTAMSGATALEIFPSTPPISITDATAATFINPPNGNAPLIQSSPGATVCFRNNGLNPTSIGTIWASIFTIVADLWRWIK